MSLDQFPVDGIREERVDVGESSIFVRTIQLQIFPISDSGHQSNPQECRKTKDWCTLRLGIAMNRIGLNVGIILEQSIKQVNRFPDPTGNEV